MLPVFLACVIFILLSLVVYDFVAFLLHFCCISVVFAVVLFILRHLVYEVACSVLEHSVSI